MSSQPALIQSATSASAADTGSTGLPLLPPPSFPSPPATAYLRRNSVFVDDASSSSRSSVSSDASSIDPSDSAAAVIPPNLPSSVEFLRKLASNSYGKDKGKGNGNGNGHVAPLLPSPLSPSSLNPPPANPNAPERSKFLANYHNKQSPHHMRYTKDTSRLFSRFSMLNEIQPDGPSPFAFNSDTHNKLMSLLKTWRFVQPGEDLPWHVPVPPWISRGFNALMAEKEREDIERQLMLFEDLSMTEFLEAENKGAKKLEMFCSKVATYLMAKAMQKVWKAVNELGEEKIERAKMGAADTFSRVLGNLFKAELVRAHKRFLSQKKLEYQQWAKQDKKPILDVERFDKVKKLSIDW